MKERYDKLCDDTGELSAQESLYALVKTGLFDFFYETYNEILKNDQTKNEQTETGTTATEQTEKEQTGTEQTKSEQIETEKTEKEAETEVADDDIDFNLDEEQTETKKTEKELKINEWMQELDKLENNFSEEKMLALMKEIYTSGMIEDVCEACEVSNDLKEVVLDIKADRNTG